MQEGRRRSIHDEAEPTKLRSNLLIQVPPGQWKRARIEDVDSPNISKMHAETQQNRLDFLQTDLALCFTFSDLAATELETMGDREAALRVQAKAEEGHAAIASFLLDVGDGPQKQAIQQKLADLRSKLDSLQGALQPGTAASG